MAPVLSSVRWIALAIDSERVEVSDKLAVEASDNHDVGRSELADARALSWDDGWHALFVALHLVQLDLHPRVVEVLKRELQSLDCVRILLVCVFDSAKNEDVLVAKVARGVVMSSFLKHG